MFKVNDTVSIAGTHARKYPGNWTVTKVNPRTYKLTQGSRVVNFDHALVKAALEEGESLASQILAVKRDPNLRAGALVRPHSTRLQMPPGLYVVLKDNYDVVNVVQLGGNADRRYWRLHPSHVEVVHPDTVLAA